MRKAILLLALSSPCFAGEGPGPEPKTTNLNAVPPGYKLVKENDDCKPFDPCSKEKKEIEKLKAENQKLKKRIDELENEPIDCDCPVCPKPQVKTVYVDKFKEVPVEKRVEVEKATFKKNVFRLLGAVGQDGLETSASESDQYAEDASVYWSLQGGIGYTRFFDDTFGLGIFGLMGGVNKTIGISGEFAF